jgi:hypothetical protein
MTDEPQYNPGGNFLRIPDDQEDVWHRGDFRCGRGRRPSRKSAATACAIATMPKPRRAIPPINVVSPGLLPHWP